MSSWGKGGVCCVFTCVGWQVTLCDPIWQVTLHSCVMEFVPLTAYSTVTFTLFSPPNIMVCELCVHYLRKIVTMTLLTLYLIHYCKKVQFFLGSNNCLFLSNIF